MPMEELYHHGILGQKWGIRRYQNPDGSLTKAGVKHIARQEKKWVRKNSGKITKAAAKSVKNEMRMYGRQLQKETKKYNANGRLSNTYIFKFNQMQASLMTKKVSDLRTPSGKTIAFVAKRGELGVYMAIADQGYNLNQLKNGVNSSGKIAYKKEVVNKMEVDR